MKSTYSLRCSGDGGGGGSLLTLLFQQHRIKGCECVLSILWVSLTGINTGAPHFNPACLRQMREGNICTSVTRSVIKRASLLLCIKAGHSVPEALEVKFMWERGRCLRFRAVGMRGLCAVIKKCERVTGKSLTHTQLYSWLLYHVRQAL